MHKKSLRERFYYGHGKLLLSSEYFIMDGARGIALPTTLGQSLSVKNSPSYQPTLNWKSYDAFGRLWFEAIFEFWHFDLIKTEKNKHTEFLQKVLRQVRKQNPHFLRDDEQVNVETRLGFPLEWGLGSSSSLLYNIAQWAYVSPFELQKETFPGSGYDVACAQSYGPITFQKVDGGPTWKETSFFPSFYQNLYFVYLGKKMDTQQAINHYNSIEIENKNIIIDKLSHISDEFIRCQSFKYFEQLINEHEQIISESLGLPKVKELYFSDYWGSVKSLGAWGGDFVLVASNKEPGETKEFFLSKGFDVFIPYQEIITLDRSKAQKESVHASM